MSEPAVRDDRRRFRTPLGHAVMGYKALLGLLEVAAGAVLALPGVDVEGLFRRLVANELSEDPGDLLVAFASRHLPSLVAHRALVAGALLLLGAAKLAAAGGMWVGKEWGRHLLLAVVLVALPFDLRSAVVRPSPATIALAAANAAVAAVLLAWHPLRGKERE